VILEKLPATATGIALIEVPEAGEAQLLPTRSGVEVRWLSSRVAPSGRLPMLAEAVRDVSWPAAGSVFAWVGTESAAVRAICEHLDVERDLDRQRKLAIGYWNRGLAEDVYHDRHDNDREAEDRYEQQHDDDHHANAHHDDDHAH
jgi:NADPH-dependent ferric siderophore reductase